MTVSSRAIKILSVLVIGTAWSLLAQVNTGELRVVVTDPAGAAPHVAVTVSSEGTHYRNTLTTDSSGAIDCKELPFGIYSVQVDRLCSRIHQRGHTLRNSRGTHPAS
jgi:hypothetical protein